MPVLDIFDGLWMNRLCRGSVLTSTGVAARCFMTRLPNLRSGRLSSQCRAIVVNAAGLKRGNGLTPPGSNQDYRADRVATPPERHTPKLLEKLIGFQRNLTHASLAVFGLVGLSGARQNQETSLFSNAAPVLP